MNFIITYFHIYISTHFELRFVCFYFIFCFNLNFRDKNGFADKKPTVNTLTAISVQRGQLLRPLRRDHSQESTNSATHCQYLQAISNHVHLDTFLYNPYAFVDEPTSLEILIRHWEIANPARVHNKIRNLYLVKVHGDVTSDDIARHVDEAQRLAQVNYAYDADMFQSCFSIKPIRQRPSVPSRRSCAMVASMAIKSTWTLVWKLLPPGMQYSLMIHLKPSSSWDEILGVEFPGKSEKYVFINKTKIVFTQKSLT